MIGAKISFLIGSGEPHAQESVGKAVDFCSALVIVGEQLLVQEGADGVLDGAGGFQGVDVAVEDVDADVGFIGQAGLLGLGIGQAAQFMEAGIGPHT